MAAAGLQCLGVSLGDHLVGSGPDNPKGFWENSDVLRIDEEALAAIGQDWQAAERFSDDAFAAPALAPLRDAGRAALRDQSSRFPLFGLKEPRLCRLLPFWRPIFDDLGCDISLVYVVRDPASVARSLATRNRLPMPRGRALWLRYVLDSFNGADPAWPAVVVQHQLMMQDPIGQLRRMAAALQLPLDDGMAKAFAATFIDERLWHERDVTAIGGPVGDVWGLCRDAASDSLSLDEFRTRLADIDASGA